MIEQIVGKTSKRRSPLRCALALLRIGRGDRHAKGTMFETHGNQCCFIDERTGARCPSRAFIQRDHVHMQAHGGGHESGNLRPLCAAHNRYLAELAFGREYVERCIDLRQRKHLGPKTPTET